jgi:hypothetical protein
MTANGPWDLPVPEPLARLFFACEHFCVAACCGLDAFDHNATTIAHWVREAGEQAAVAQRQLEDLIAAVSAVSGAVSSTWDPQHETWFPTFETEWKTGAECAAYLREWHAELTRAMAFPPRPVEPERILADAAARGPEDFWREVDLLAGEAHGAIQEGRLARAMDLLSALAALDRDAPENQRCASKIDGARWELAKLRSEP